jgi:hypothetical protein
MSVRLGFYVSAKQCTTQHGALICSPCSSQKQLLRRNADNKIHIKVFNEQDEQEFEYSYHEVQLLDGLARQKNQVD